jgi:NAD(P)-dependent dehydrogenase (short-subunit alcohol dehydrogenase family)
MSSYLIIGASSGIGLALAEKLSESHTVFGTYKTNAKSSASIQYFYHDVNQDLDVNILPEVIDGFCYCPGSIDLKPFARISPEAFIEDYKLQVIGAIKSLQAVMPKLKASSKASVVFFSTVAVQSGFTFHSLVSSSKGAIEGLTKALAAEYSPNIRFNCIAPSLTNTPLASNLLNTDDKIKNNANRHPMKRIGSASDIAEFAAYLLSEKSSWITGQTIHVDGGISTLKV